MTGKGGWVPNPPEPGRCYDQDPQSHYHCDLEVGHSESHRATRGFYTHLWADVAEMTQPPEGLEPTGG